MPAALKPGAELSGLTVFGELTVLRIERDPARLRHYALCRCSCGVEKSVRIDHLRTGKTTSCGHIARQKARDRISAVIEGATVHGMHGSRVYNIWHGMRQRCGNPKHPSYHRYGGRGIKVCKRWHKFEYFLADMGRPPDGYELERNDNDDGYSPKNCRWASHSDQMNNRSTNRKLTINGETLTLAQWARRVGLHYNTLAGRLDDGWPPERAINPQKFRNLDGLKLRWTR